jgi:Zn finger protein HypA/HybF involved in hydrogenase expression
MSNIKKRSIRLQYDDIIIKLYDKYKDKITLLTKKDDYLGTHYKSDFKCNVCNHIFSQSVNKMLSKLYKSGCSNCKLLNKNYISIDEINKKLITKNIKIISNDKLLLIDKKYDFLCINCNKLYNNSLRNVLNSNSCSNCSKYHHNYTINEIKQLLLKNNSNIKIVDITYFSISNKSKFICKLCNNEWSTLTRSVVYGVTGCPKCNKSHGEKYIENYLIKNKIKYITQYTFDDCRNKRKLPFDFYLPDYNMCIEFDGYLHYFPWNDDYKSIEKFNNTKNNDKIKDLYCKNNNIKMIRIPYKDFKNLKNKLDVIFTH